jgi:hypothetical protein
MSPVEQPVVSSHEQVVSDLTSYARGDWLSLEVITSSVRDCFDHKPSFAEVRPLAIRAVRDLVRAGAMVGDVAGANHDWCFVPWAVPPEQAIDRITKDLEERDNYPEPGEIGWLTFPD